MVKSEKSAYAPVSTPAYAASSAYPEGLTNDTGLDANADKMNYKKKVVLIRQN